MALQDDITRLTSIVVSLHRVQLLAQVLRRSVPITPSELGKLCGVTAETMLAWERGELQPTTQQALAWLTVLWDRQRPAVAPAPFITTHEDMQARDAAVTAEQGKAQR
jgi:DNA-binding XRE family transcriptional regulator